MSELGPNARAVLDAGRDGDDPTPGDRARIRASMMKAIAAGGATLAAAGESAAAGTAAKAATGLPFVWKVIAGIAVIGAAGGGVAVVAGSGAKEPAKAPTAAVSPPPAEIAFAQTISSAVPSEAPAVAATPSASAASTAMPASSAAPKPSARATAGLAPSASGEASHPATPIAAANEVPAVPAAPAAAPAPAGPPDTLTAETQRLREAHGALQSGDGSRALSLLDEQNAGGAELREERAAARVLALCKLGRVEEARAAAAQFLQQNPRSPLADRVRGSCAGAR